MGNSKGHDPSCCCGCHEVKISDFAALQQENERLKAQVQGSQAMADEKCRCFLERAERAEAELQQAKLDVEHWRTVDGHVEKLEAELQQAREELRKENNRWQLAQQSCDVYKQQLAQSRATLQTAMVTKNLDISALQARLDEAVGLLGEVARNSDEWDLERITDHYEVCRRDAAAFLAAQRKD